MASAIILVSCFFQASSGLSAPPRRSPCRARVIASSGRPLPCTEENLLATIAQCVDDNSDMFGCHQRCADIGVTGMVELVDFEGPFVTIKLEGRFWHRRRTVLQRVGQFISRRIPEIVEITLADPTMAEDFELDEDGVLAYDKRSPDFNGDRETMTRNGYDPDARGPFPDRNALSVFV